MSRGAFLNESTIISSYISVVGILLQHINLQFNFLLFILHTKSTHLLERLKKKLEMVFPLGSKSWVSVRPVSINHYHVISDRDQYIQFRNESM